ncbi:MAG TPA: serine hydrolase [Anaerolineales bacterium]|nr:serine hydrolase [Anaerolineales bacterium]
MTEIKNKSRKLKIAFLGVIITAVSVVVLYPLLACLVYPPEYVYRALTWGAESVYDYQRLPGHPLRAGSNPFYFPEDLQEVRVHAAFKSGPQIDDLEGFLVDTGTQAFIVIQDDHILYEKYFNGIKRDSIVTSFSVAKSFTSALIGLAIADGFIHSVDDPITDYLPELISRDVRFGAITIRDLLMMSSGIHYFEDIPSLSDDGTKTYLFTDLRRLALEYTHIKEQPGRYFQYNNYHPLLLGMILERTTGISVSEYLEQKIWQPLGMEFDGSWSLDSEENGFEKMESGINARAIDFAKFGRLYLHSGNWNGEQVIPAEWVLASTREDPKVDRSEYYGDLDVREPLDGYYKYMWWGLPRRGGAYDFSALGNLGQFIYVSPQANLIIVRNGERDGIHYNEWLALFYHFANSINTPPT